MTFIPIIVILVVFVIALLTKFSKEKEKAVKPDEPLDKPLDDDLIYDHLSGRYLTLEEAENEVIDGDQYINRIKSDEEIQKHYSAEQQEVEYILRHIIQSNITETEDDRIFELVEFSKLYDAVEYTMNYLWEIKPDHFLGIAYVSYYVGTKFSGHENQLLGIVQGDTLKNEFEVNADIQFAELNNTRVFKIPTKITFNEFKRFKDLILDNDQAD
jgi:hypothetical protein